VKIHEYQGKGIFAEFGIPVPKGRALFKADEASKVAKELGSGPWAVKAQIHAGGRGKGGGVKIAKSLDEVDKYAKSILGMTLVTHQTGPAGKVVKRLLIEECQKIKKEYYAAFVLDRARAKVVCMVSGEGGMEIEKVAESSPEKIFKEHVSPELGMTSYKCKNIGFKLGLDGKTVNKLTDLLMKLYKVYIAKDCSLVEVNPLILTEGGDFVALDSKINFDDNALFRHPEIKELRDPDEEDPRELAASKFDLNYIGLDGNIGCMVNGAGLAMATMDIIKLQGGNPANFLDVGGGASLEAVTEAFKILVSDVRVKAILVNIFGGIVKCDVIAQGVVGAAKQVGLKLPLVVRLEGTNVDEGKRILKESGLKLEVANDMSDAAKRVVSLA
jgi:succinyl-CoA synthetase beta subunit